MDHTHIVQAADLDRYSPTRECQAVIPELVYLLIKQAVPPPLVCRIPYGDVVNQPGWDGLVEIEQAFLEYVPAGVSYWEIGTGADPKTKASTDFKKRTEALSDEERAQSSFVFITSRSSAAGGWNEPEQSAWLKERKESGWNCIRIIDGVKLADWLREFPALGRWMAKKVGITASLGGIITPGEHWDLILSQGDKKDPPLPPQLFTTSRSGAMVSLEAVFSGDSQRLFLFAESEDDVEDFVAAYLSTLEEEKGQEYANRCLFINDEEAWRTVSELRQSHILVANPRLGLDMERQNLQAVATRKGHGVIIPLCGALSGDNPEIIKLRSPTQSQIESVLKEANFSEVRARELGGIGGGRISALRRYLLGLGSVPPYVNWETARELAQAALVGQWNANCPADVLKVEELLGKGYGEWIEKLRSDALRSDSPLIQTDERWRFVARGEAWNALGNRITDDDLARFEAIAVLVFSERDPRFDLPKEERFAASIHGKVLEHSSLLRKGLAETLALLGSRPKALSGCSLGKPEITAILVVRQLLNKAGWERWASLDSLMPLLAEAAPDEFLDAVESVLTDLTNTPFHKIFGEEGGGGIGGSCYMSGLLWALETLAWKSDFLSRVSVVLADIASIDPGGNWTNRPANSLADIYLPWHVQTTAPFDKRKSAIEAVIREQPAVGWKLLLALLPHNHGFTSGCHRPVWRDYIPRDWKDGVLRTEYWEQITAYTDLAVALAKNDSGKLCELIKRLADLPNAAHENLLDHLASDAVVSLPEAERLPIWESLDELARHHRKYSDADWSMPEDAVNKIAETAKALAPASPEFKYHQLFGGRDFDLYDEKGNYEEQQKRLDEARQAAISEIIGSGGLDAALSFAANVSAPYEVGRALGVIASDEIENSILPPLLCSEDDSVIRVVAGFVWARFWRRKTEWVDAVLQRAWSPENHAKFLTLLPFEEEIWQRVATSLTATHEALYWKNAKVNPYGPDRDLTVAIEKLLEYGREGAAVMCVARTADDKSRFDETLATRALLAVLESERGIEEMSNYDTVELIKHLQGSATTDKDALFRIEWNFLPWLDRFSSGSPVTLENRLATDPTFFAEAIGLVYRSKNVSEEDHEEFDEHKKHLARNAYKLLDEWGRCPGRQSDGSFSAEAFNGWLNEARRLTEESGHTEVAQIQIGHVLTCAPPDPDGLWIHNAVAAALNFRDTGEMRSGFTTQLFNDRGVHGFSHGKEERELADDNRKKAEALDSKGYTRFATAMREFAEQYERQAEREAKREPFED
jgi:hypothetical protein